MMAAGFPKMAAPGPQAIHQRAVGPSASACENRWTCRCLGDGMEGSEICRKAMDFSKSKEGLECWSGGEFPLGNVG